MPEGIETAVGGVMHAVRHMYMHTRWTVLTKGLRGDAEVLWITGVHHVHHSVAF